MKWWAKLFESPLTEVKQLMDGLNALKEAEHPRSTIFGCEFYLEPNSSDGESYYN
jgi:hypothetical protein